MTARTRGRELLRLRRYLIAGGSIMIGVIVLFGMKYYHHNKRLAQKLQQKQALWKRIVQAMIPPHGHNSIGYFRTLVDNNLIDLNEKDPNSGYTLLMWAAFYGNYPVCRLLVHLNADIALPNDAQLTALDIAKQHSNLNIVDLLTESGAVDSSPLVVNQTLAFDVCYKQYKSFNVEFDGTSLVKHPNDTGRSVHSICFASSAAWNKGIHELRVQCTHPGKDCIGITTDIEHCSVENSWFTDIERTQSAYVWVGDAGLWSSCRGTHTEICNKNTSFQTGDIIRVVVDCEALKATFYRNNEIYASFEIESKTYYPMINLQASSKTSAYKIL